MAEITRSALFGKLNEIAYQSLERATVLCRMRGNPYLELQHWINVSLADPKGDLARICERFALDIVALQRDIDQSLDRLPGGEIHVTDISQFIEDSVDRAWTYATLLYRRSSIRTGDVIVALLKTPSLSRALVTISPLFANINVHQLTEQLADIVAGSPEDHTAARDGSGGIATEPDRRKRTVFLSYRRADSMHLVGRLFDRLEDALGDGNVFKDVDSMPAGIPNYQEEIREQIKTAKIMLVVIGANWLTTMADGQRRINDKHDLVRLELRHALEHRLTVIPLLSDGASMPKKLQLPASIRNFALCQSMRIRVDPDFRNDMAVLIARCRSVLAVDAPP